MSEQAPTLSVMRPIYEKLWSGMAYRDGIDRVADKTALRLLSNLPRYMAMQERFGIPAAFLMVTHERESGGNWDTYAGNGDPLHNRQGAPLKSVNVPANRGPFKNYEDGAYDAYCVLQGLDKIGIANWDEARLCYFMEAFNGWGYWLYHGHMPSPYLWGGTNQQEIGKYRSDGHYDPTLMDTQLGGMAVYGRIIFHAPELDIGGAADTPAALRASGVQPPTPVTLPPAAPVVVQHVGTAAATTGTIAVAAGAVSAGVPLWAVVAGIAVAAVVGFFVYSRLRRAK